jgi:tRNA guanosine-2'-O-methyltransferase
VLLLHYAMSPSVFLSLVDHLAKRHDSGRPHNATLDAEEQASRLFLISCDVIGAFRLADLCEHLEHMMLNHWPSALHSEAGSRDKDTAPSSSPTSLMPATSVSSLVAASGALVGFLWSHRTEFHDDNASSGAVPRSAWASDVHEQWQSNVLQLLTAHPPFPVEACTAACYTVGQLSLLPGGCCARVLKAACEALQAGREDGLTAVLATELLGQCTSLMVVCRPFQLSGFVIEDPTLKHKREQESENKKRKQTKIPGLSTQTGKRTRPSTQRPEVAEARSSVNTSAVDAIAATAAEESTSACTAVPSCYPFPNAEHIAHLKAELIECCLGALGASAPADASWENTQQNRAVPTARICQRILIPLLLLDGSEGLQRYEELIHNLLHTLATRMETTAAGGSAVSTTAGDGVGQHGYAGQNDGLYGDKDDDVVLLIAALFDFLFRHPSLNPATDFRFSPFLWGVLSSAMHRSLTASEKDAGQRSNMQLRVEYLLKRIVYLTKEQQYQQAHTASPLPAVVEFHPLFCWYSALSPATGESLSATSWDSFFLVLESLNEYGWHIIEPVMARLDTLIADLSACLESNARVADPFPTEAPPLQGALHTQWIEMLLLKLILHPNVGVRKVGLRRVWGLPPRVLQSLSASFLFQYTFESASDPRLCADLDRIPITASFLDTKAFEGTELKAVPDVEPLAQEVERFYSTLFLSRWPRDAAASAATSSVQGRIDALCRLLDTTLSKPPRFTVCVLARTLFAVAQALLDHHINAEPILLDSGVLRRLHRFMRDSVQENIPFWLDVRVTVILFAALTTFAAATPSPRRCRQDLSFWRLYCMCGPLGESGGHSITGMDACGQYGLVGASVDERFLQQWLVSFSAQVQEKALLQQQQQQHEYECVAEGSAATPAPYVSSFIEDLLDVAGIEDRVGRLLWPTTDVLTSAVAAVKVVEIKETFFLVGALIRTGSPSDVRVIQQVGYMIASTVASLQTRAYCPVTQLLASAACLVEFHHTVGSDVCAQLWPLHTTLQSVSAALHAHAMSSLVAALNALRNPDEGCDSTTLFADASLWTLMKTSHFDTLAAAITSVNAIACSSCNGDDGSVRTLAETNNEAIAAAAAAGELLCAPDHVHQLMTLLQETAETYCTLTTAGKRNSDEAVEERISATLVVTRNVYRLLQSELCGFLAVGDSATGAPGKPGNDGFLHSPPLPASRELPPTSSSIAGASIRCPLCLVLPQHAVRTYVQQLISLPAYRVPTGSVPSALLDIPWSTLLGQHGRYRCNILYVFALCLKPVSEQAEPDTHVGADLAALATQADLEHYVVLVQQFALEQLEECWTMNLASVYDLLVWVASFNLPPRVVNYIAIADGMWNHMKEVGARQFTRLAALAFTVLHSVMPHHPHYVRDLLLRVLEGEGKEAHTADREVYFAALTASLQVLHNPTQNWPVLREVLIYAAVLFNTNRDEEENESTVAVTEPLLWSWPEELRLYYPPTTRMSAVGRAMAVATLLWCCHTDVAGRAVPLTMELLRMNVCNPVVTHEPCMPNSRTHRTRIRLWQLLCAVLPCLAQQQQQQPVALSKIEEVFRLVVLHCMTVNNMGSVRRLMELYAIRLVEKHPSLYTIISEALGNYSLRPQVCGSYILIACHALLRQEDRQLSTEETGSCEEVAADMFDHLFPRILQQSTSNQHLLRIISHIGLVNICQRRLYNGRPLPPAVRAVYDYVVHAPEHIKFREKHEHMLFFDTDAASSPRNLFCVQRKEANTVLAEVLPAAVFERIRFVETELCCMIGALYPMELLRVREWCSLLRVQELVSVFRDFALIPHTSAPCDYYVDYTQEVTELLTRDPMLGTGSGVASAGVAGETVDAATVNVQKKVSSWWTSEVYNELHPRALRTQKQPIIVIGSLLQNPVNIAGLCRCGEIFAVESIVVPEKKVFEHPHFVAAARSAELWIPWEEVMPEDLPCYLEGLRRRGYTIVGIEQTANSVSIEVFSFPERCAVVLGAEGQGVPAPLIPLLDVCVEIPQYGLIRSLNVHVTGAITMYEYTRQHLMGKSAQ